LKGVPGGGDVDATDAEATTSESFPNGAEAVARPANRPGSPTGPPTFPKISTVKNKSAFSSRGGMGGGAARGPLNSVEPSRCSLTAAQ